MGGEDGQTQTTVANVLVVVRCRPLNAKEQLAGDNAAVEFPAPVQIAVKTEKEDNTYAFDHVFQPDADQECVYQALGIPLLERAFGGYNSTIFAYGQTGSGKTHTMSNHSADAEHRGLIPRVADGLFQRIDALQRQHESRRFLLCCSFLEIYNEIINDLLVAGAKHTKGGLEVKEQRGIGIYVKDLTEIVVDSSDKLNDLIEHGFRQRATASTKMNDTSSRSHCVFIIKLHQKDPEDESKNTFSKLNLVDLAGSERVKQSEATGDRLVEASNINKSLSALGNVINALSKMEGGAKKVFVPYRNSKLTRILQESLGGNGLCTMLAAVSPASSNVEETLSTLNYARRAKTIKVTAIKNDSAAQIRLLKEEVDSLRNKLSEQGSLGAGKERQELCQKYEAQISELQSFMLQSWEEKQRLSEEHAREQRQYREEVLRAKEQVQGEQQRRLQLLEATGDLRMSLQFLSGLESSLCGGLPDRVMDVLNLEQQLRAQVSAVVTSWESIRQDFKIIRGSELGHSLLTLLSQLDTKLGSITEELDALVRLEGELEEQMGRLAPEVVLIAREARVVAEAGSIQGIVDDEEQARAKEVAFVVTLVQRQFNQQHVRALAFLNTARGRLALGPELRWVVDCLEGDACHPNPGRVGLLTALREEAAMGAASDDGGALSSSNPSAEPTEGSASAVEAELPGNLGLSNFLHPDSCLSASCNEVAAASARLGLAVAYGGWCPSASSELEFLEVDLGQECCVFGLSVQGRVPCSSSAAQTRDLLRLALEGCTRFQPPVQEKVFRRPPVRLVHELAIALVNDMGCFRNVEGAWQVPQEFFDFPEMGRYQKVAFFREIIRRTNLAYWAAAKDGGMDALAITAEDVLAGRNSGDLNKLLQLLAYLALQARSPQAANGLFDASPQWITRWKLNYFTAAEGWTWYCSEHEDGEAHVFDGTNEASEVRTCSLSKPVVASKLRLHPLAWHRHAGLRCEVCTAGASAGRVKPGESVDGDPGGGRSADDLKFCMALTQRSLQEVKGLLEDRHRKQCRQAEEVGAGLNALQKNAEQDRAMTEKYLQDALARVEEIKAEVTTNEERSASAAKAVLQTLVERNRLRSRVEQLESSLSAATEAKAATEEQCLQLRQDGRELLDSMNEMGEQLKVVREERDLSRGKEEEYFLAMQAREDEVADTAQGYIRLTHQLQKKEEELAELHAQKHLLEAKNKRLTKRYKMLKERTGVQEETPKTSKECLNGSNPGKALPQESPRSSFTPRRREAASSAEGDGDGDAVEEEEEEEEEREERAGPDGGTRRSLVTLQANLDLIDDILGPDDFGMPG